jgi:ElaB/YqjD/DUF883 family membrane-anchored ribosome-binding protein
MNHAPARDLIDDLRAVVADAEALLAATAGDVSERARQARHKAAESVEKARANLEELEGDLKAKAKAMADDATEYVRDNPWQSVGIAAAVGVVIGVLLGRR